LCFSTAYGQAERWTRPLRLDCSAADRKRSLLTGTCARARYRFGRPREASAGLRPFAVPTVLKTHSVWSALVARELACNNTCNRFRKFTYRDLRVHLRARVYGSARISGVPDGLAASDAFDRARVTRVHGVNRTSTQRLVAVTDKWSLRVPEIAYDTAVWSRSHVNVPVG